MAVVVDVHPDKPYTPRVKRMVGIEMKVEAEPIDLSIDGAPQIETVGGTPVTGMVPVPMLA